VVARAGGGELHDEREVRWFQLTCKSSRTFRSGPQETVDCFGGHAQLT
jgi:hypothetical protein